MAQIPYTQSSVVGATIPWAPAAAGDTVAVASDGVLLVRNGSGSPVTVTVVVPGSKYGQARPDITKAIAAGADAVFGPFPADIGDPTDRMVHVNYSATADVERAAISI